MKILQIVFALVVVGVFAVTCEAELAGTGIVKKVWIEEREPRGIDFGEGLFEPSPESGYIVKTIWVEIEEPDNDESKKWNTITGGFASDGEFWNLYKYDLQFGSSTFTISVDNDELSFESFDEYSRGTEFLVPTMEDMERGWMLGAHTDWSTGSNVVVDGEQLGGGQLLTRALYWAPPTDDEGHATKPLQTATGEFPLAQLIVRPESKIYTIWNDGSMAATSAVLGPIEFLGGGKVLGTIVPEPSSMALAMLGAGLAGVLVYWRRRRA